MKESRECDVTRCGKICEVAFRIWHANTFEFDKASLRPDAKNCSVPITSACCVENWSSFLCFLT
jgi:hypothetical protein